MEAPGRLNTDVEDDCPESFAQDSQETNNQIAGAIVPRSRLKEDDAKPIAHIGTIASADTVMKTGRYRDRIAETDTVIAFKMEEAGIWNHLPCLVIKGVCDYSDSHKNKSWQDYTAATGACAAKTFLNHWRPSIKRDWSHKTRRWKIAKLFLQKLFTDPRS